MKGYTYGKKVNVATLGLNEHFLSGKTQEEVIPAIMERLEALAGYHPDLIVLPEAFLKIGGDSTNPAWPLYTEKMLLALQDYALRNACYIAASVYEQVPEYPHLKYNTVTLINRQGLIQGKYRKVHTVVEESRNSLVLPGKDYPVFDTDFGRIGFQICFDIGWREGWQKLADQGAQLVIWTAAYDGGNLLNTYAAYHMYYVVSSVRTQHAKIIDPTGRTIAESARWDHVAMATIDLESGLFHIDRQFQKIPAIRKALGDRVTIRAYSEENVFTLESNDPQWPLSRICREFGLMSYQDYHAEATREQELWREKYPAGQ